MFCDNCGKNLPDGTAFCPECGARINASAPQQSATPEPLQQAAPVYQQQSYQQSNYQSAPAQSATSAPADASVLGIGTYVGMYIVSCIPVIGLIMMLVWAFSSGQNPNKTNFAKAMLIIILIGVALAIVFGIIFTVVGMSVYDGISTYASDIF